MKTLRLMLTLVVALFAAHAHATLAKITAVGSYGDGSVFIFFDTVISSCGSSQRIDLAATHPSLKNVLSIAEAAFATGSSVIVNTGICSGATPVFTTDGGSYLYLAK